MFCVAGSWAFRAFFRFSVYLDSGWLYLASGGVVGSLETLSPKPVAHNRWSRSPKPQSALTPSALRTDVFEV